MLKEGKYLCILLNSLKDKTTVLLQFYTLYIYILYILVYIFTYILYSVLFHFFK